ncbi:MAG: atpB, partial [Flaviaesturariibacter sp.]|nr:atpB [Flaviaesturariibacter sp.]
MQKGSSFCFSGLIIPFLPPFFRLYTLIFAANLGKGMTIRRVKSLMVAAFSAFCLSFSLSATAQAGHEAGGVGDAIGGETVHQNQHDASKAADKPIFDANEVIFGHVLDAHQFHFFSYKGSDGHENHIGIPLPVIVYDNVKGLSVFSSSQFHHGEHSYNGYRLVTPEYKEHIAKFYSEADMQKFHNESIIAVDANDMPVPGATVYDFSITRNVIQMLIALTVLVVIMLGVAKKYRQGQGVTTAPRGMQN